MTRYRLVLTDLRSQNKSVGFRNDCFSPLKLTPFLSWLRHAVLEKFGLGNVSRGENIHLS
jgi:hypothetical protein